jgi:hypothetical protein
VNLGRHEWTQFCIRVDNQHLQAQHIYKLWNCIIITERIYTLVPVFCCHIQTSHKEIYTLVLVFCCHTQTSRLVIFHCYVSSQGVPFHRVSYLRCICSFPQTKSHIPSPCQQNNLAVYPYIRDYWYII